MRIHELEGKEVILTTPSKSGDRSFVGDVMFCHKVTEKLAYFTRKVAWSSCIDKVVLGLDSYKEDCWEESQWGKIDVSKHI